MFLLLAAADVGAGFGYTLVKFFLSISRQMSV
jgi:hypothetical protein